MEVRSWGRIVDEDSDKTNHGDKIIEEQEWIGIIAEALRRDIMRRT